jgi:hypothetical protein
MKHITLAIIALPALLACGGGSGGSGGLTQPTGSNDTQTDTQTDTRGDTVPPITGDGQPAVTLNIVAENSRSEGAASAPSVVSRSADIVVPEGFNIQYDQTYRLSMVHDDSDQDAYLSVCSDYHLANNDELQINYQNCALRTTVKGGEFAGSFTLGSEVDSVAVAIWFLDSSIEPVIIDWVFDQH